MNNNFIIVPEEEALFVTHSGIFHADDVMAAAIISMRYSGSNGVRLARVPSINHDIGLGLYFDIGGGKFDHHQKGGNGFRDNGVPYASAGLIWNRFGYMIIDKFGRHSGIKLTSKSIKSIMNKVDYDLIQGIDANDCGVFPPVNYPTQGTTISTAIRGFNPCWRETQDFDGQFLRAVDFALDVLNNCIRSAVSSVLAEDVVYGKIEESDGQLLILEESLPWMSPIFNPSEETKEKAASLLYAIFPGLRGGWQWRAIPTELKKGAPFRNPTPDSWCGFGGLDLQKKCGIDDATFVHQSGHTGGAQSREGTIMMVKKMIEIHDEEE